VNIIYISLIFPCYNKYEMCLQESSPKEMDIRLTKCEKWLVFHWFHTASPAEGKIGEDH